MYHDNILLILLLSSLEKFSESQIVANAFVMFSAGFETVSITMSFCLHELALKKNIQDRVRNEIKLKKHEYNGVINNEFLMALNYLDMVIAGDFLHIQVLCCKHIFAIYMINI